MKPLLGSEKLYLVGFRVDPDDAHPQVYSLYVEDERPVLRQGRPLLFVRPDLAARVLDLSDCGAAKLNPAPEELYTVFDMADALYTLESRDEALDGGLLDCINAIFDFLPFLGDPMPEQYRVALRRLADHLTFHLRFSEFLEEQDISRTTLTDAFLWFLGATVYHARIIF